MAKMIYHGFLSIKSIKGESFQIHPLYQYSIYILYLGNFSEITL